MQLAEAFVSIQADDSAFKTGLEGVQKSLEGIGKKMQGIGKDMSLFITGPATLATGAVYKLTKDMGDYADSIFDLSAATGHAADTLQEWQVLSKMAGTGLNIVSDASMKLTRSMGMGEEGSAKMNQGLRELGYTMQDLEAVTPDERMNMLMQALAGVEDEGQRAKIGMQLFGGSYKELAPIIGMGNEEMERAIALGYETGEIMSGDALKGADDFRVGMVEVQMALKGMMNELGTQLLPLMTDVFVPFVKDTLVPVIKGIVGAVTDVVEWFNNLNPVIQKFIIALGAILVVAGPILLFLGTVAIKISALMPVIMTVVTAIGTAGGAIAAFVAGPIALIVAGIAGVIAIGVLLYKNWEEICEFAVNLKDTVVEAFVGMWEAVTEKVTEIKDSVTEKFEEILDFVFNLKDRFKEAGKNIMEGVKEGITSKIDDIKNSMQNVTKSIRDFLPFSPAKVGPLRDLNKLNFGGTIADSIENGKGQISTAMNSALSNPSYSGGGGGSANIYIDLDGRTIAQAIGQHLVNDIRVATGARI